MARPRQWSDIDRQWLSGYLIRKGLGKNFNLGSDALVADVAERLSGEEWRAMRQSWTTRGRTVNALSAVHDSEVTQAPEVPNEGIMPLATDRSAGLEKAISGLKKLQQKALGDWDAFGELLELPTDLLESIRDQSATPLKFLQAAHGKPHVPEPPNQRVGVGNGPIHVAMNGLHAYRHQCLQKGVRPSLDHARRYMTALRAMPEQTLEEAWRHIMS